VKRNAAAGLAVAAAALFAGVALNQLRTGSGLPLDLVSASGVFVSTGNRMTPSEVRVLFGKPDEVFRENPRALCWRFVETDIEVRMCWGAHRKQALFSATGEGARALAQHPQRHS
jgi:hypothetical protein